MTRTSEKAARARGKSTRGRASALPIAPAPPRPVEDPIIVAVVRCLDPLIEPGRVLTLGDLARNLIAKLGEAGFVIVPR